MHSELDFGDSLSMSNLIFLDDFENLSLRACMVSIRANK